MTQRLTKRALACKTIVALQLLSLGATVCNAQAGDTDDLRTCVAAADNLASISKCEQQHQKNLMQQIEAYSQRIREKLGAPERVLFDRNTMAWHAWLESEKSLLELTFGARPDGLDTALLPGALAQLYEHRASQLREHLRNLGSVNANKRAAVDVRKP